MSAGESTWHNLLPELVGGAGLHVGGVCISLLWHSVVSLYQVDNEYIYLSFLNISSTNFHIIAKSVLLLSSCTSYLAFHILRQASIVITHKC